jgi:probable HAF family extracellular repeat protein
MRKTIVLSLAILLVLAASAPLALAQGTYTQIDVPGAVSTLATGINAAGDIVGAYDDASGVSHGFLLSGGVYTTIDYPGAAYTSVTGINDVGQIVGDDSYDGFLYDLQTQAFTTISVPGQNGYTIPLAINNAGTIVGFISIQGKGPVGFELAGGKYREVLPKGFEFSFVAGINNSGEAVGQGSNFLNDLNFLFNQGKFQPSGIPMSASANGINDLNAIVGKYLSNNNYFGFVLQNGVFQRLRFPRENYTIAQGINTSGEVVGYFDDSSGVGHGFTWTPPADAAKK